MRDNETMLLKKAYEHIQNIEILNESPDVINVLDGRRLNRYDYSDNVIIFLANNSGDGLIYGRLNDFVSHSYLLRSIVKGDMEKLKSFGKMVDGDNMDYQNSGVILFKNGDVDESYISIWRDRSNKTFLNMLKKFVNYLSVPKPIYIEYFDNGDINDDDQNMLTIFL